MMDGGIRSAGLGRKEATSNRHQVVHNSAALLQGKVEHLQGQMAGTGGKAAAPRGRWASPSPTSICTTNSSHLHYQDEIHLSTSERGEPKGFNVDFFANDPKPSGGLSEVDNYKLS